LKASDAKIEGRGEHIAKLIAQVKEALPSAHQVDPLVAEEIADRKSDRALKQKHAVWFIWILIAQLIVMNIAFFLVGNGKMTFQEWSLNLYMTGTLAQVFGVVYVITKNLFPNNQ